MPVPRRLAGYSSTKLSAVRRRINNSGDVAFTIDTRKGNGPPRPKPARYDELTGTYQVLETAGRATDINASGDVCVRANNGVAILVFPREGGVVTIDGEASGDAADVEKWNNVVSFQSAVMNDRIATTGFGQICGMVWFREENGDLRSELFLLTPTE